MAKKIIALIAFLLPVLIWASGLGDYFFERELYFEAITEYKRQFFFNQIGKKDELLLKIAKAYYQAGQKSQAEEPLIEAIGNAEQSPEDRQCLILLAKIHWDNYDYEAMRGVLNLLEAESDSLRLEHITYIRAWSYIYEAQWQNGIEQLHKVNFVDTTALISSIKGVKNVPQKSKTLASLMSNIIPGSGQLYAGDYQNALFSFLLVGSITGSIIWNIVEEAYFIAATKYLFLFSRYSRGGLRNIARKIDRDNVNRLGDYLKTVSAKFPPPIELLEKL
jgi:tetratricopeptide (TPR) repeat protein